MSSIKKKQLESELADVYYDLSRAVKYKFAFGITSNKDSITKLETEFEDLAEELRQDVIQRLYQKESELKTKLRDAQ